MSLLDNMDTPEDIAKDRGYYDVLESHLNYIKNHETTKLISVGLDQAAIFKGDFYGLLNSLSVNKKYHYLIMRINGLGSSSEYDGLKEELLRPSEGVINEIITVYQSTEIS